MQINVSSADESLNLYDSGHRFEHIQLLLVLLRSLPYASRAFQARAIQVCFHCLTVNCCIICIIMSNLPFFIRKVDEGPYEKILVY